MEIEINQQLIQLSDSATVADALTAYGAKPPYAVAVNGDFVPRARYTQHILHTHDRLDIVQPVAGG